MASETDRLLSSVVQNSTSVQEKETVVQTSTSVQDRETVAPLDKTAISCILLTLFCERLAFYSVLANFILYCTSTLELSSTDAANVNFIFTGTLYLIPPLFGYVSDVWTGKYNTIQAAGIIYTIGLLFLCASAADYQDWFFIKVSVEQRRYLFYTSLALITIGAGGIRCIIAPLGAQQVEGHGEHCISTFFNWFYWLINIGAAIAECGVGSIQQKFGFVYGFFIPLAAMIISQMGFMAGKNRYKVINEEASPVREIFKVCWISRCRGLARAEDRCSTDSVVRVRSFFKLLPILGLLIIYFAIYAQTSTTFFLQSERLDIHGLSVSLVNCFDNIAIIVLIPLIQFVFYPLLCRDRQPSLMQKIGFGMIFAVLSVIVAGVVEIKRKESLGIHQRIINNDFNASTVSVFVQIPQFTLLGVSEVFTCVGGMELAYSEAPDLMRGICMGLYLLTIGAGSYMAMLVITVVKGITGTTPPESWFPNDINQGKAQNLFFTLAILVFLNFLLFLFAARRFKERGRNRRE